MNIPLYLRHPYSPFSGHPNGFSDCLCYGGASGEGTPFSEDWGLAEGLWVEFGGPGRDCIEGRVPGRLSFEVPPRKDPES